MIDIDPETLKCQATGSVKLTANAWVSRRMGVNWEVWHCMGYRWRKSPFNR